jgi:hypothetical protein
MKTFSQASFAQVASATNIPALSHNSHTTNNRNSLPSNGSYSRSLSVPNETGSNHRISNHRLSESSQHATKKDKKKKPQQSVGEPGKLELVKMDIDNNMVSLFL